MGLHKAIQHGKEHRKGYRERGKPGEWDKTCRPHGGGTSIPCPYCERNRAFKAMRLEAIAQTQEPIDNAIGYSEEFDAKFSLLDGRWLEGPCGDDSCTYCADRPPMAPRPIQAKTGR